VVEGINHATLAVRHLDRYLAFSLSASSFDAVSECLSDAGAEIWQNNPTGVRSLYFLDPDGYKLEIHTPDLAGRLDVDRRDLPPGMRFYA
jgi:hypothetical protein